MAIPDFQSIMLPLLQFCSDAKEHTNRDTIDHLAKIFRLSEDEQEELLPSSRQAIFHNRVACARAYMKMRNVVSFALQTGVMTFCKSSLIKLMLAF